MKRSLFLITCFVVCALVPLRALPEAGDGSSHCSLGLSRPGAGDTARNLSRVDRNCVCDFYPASNPAICNKLSRQYKISAPAEKVQAKAQALASKQQQQPGRENTNSQDRPTQQEYYKQASDRAYWGQDTAKMESSVSQDISAHSRETKGNLLKYTAQELDRAAQDRSVPVKNLQNDYRVFQAASRSYQESDTGFSEKLAASAKDPHVRELMLMYSAMDTVEKKADESYAIAQQKVASFGGMADQNKQSGRKLAQAGKEIPGQAAAAVFRDKENGKIASDTVESSLAGGKKPDSAAEAPSAAAGSESEAGPKPSAQDSFRSRLRDQLRAELAKSNQKGKYPKEEEFLDHFHGELNGGLASSTDGSDAEEDLGNLIGAREEEPGFSMAHSETDTFVKQAIDGLDSMQSGILESESRGIFERVKEYYDRCIRAECVSSR